MLVATKHNLETKFNHILFRTYANLILLKLAHFCYTNSFILFQLVPGILDASLGMVLCYFSKKEQLRFYFSQKMKKNLIKFCTAKLLNNVCIKNCAVIIIIICYLFLYM